MRLTLPAVLGLDIEYDKNPIQQIAELSHECEGQLVPFTLKKTAGFLFQTTNPGEILIFPKTVNAPKTHQRVLIAVPDPQQPSNNLSDGTWQTHPSLPDEEADVDYRQQISDVLDSWAGAFSFVQEDIARKIVGLRRPQIGAVHAAHAYWAVSNAPATIVMPTGTGKTETMLSLLISMRCPRLLVVVPTDALRSQLALKFLTLGKLKAPGSTVLSSGAKTPIVCMLQHIPGTPGDLDTLFQRAQVIVTTSSIAGQCSQAVQERMAHHCPYLFIDEAHHAEAPTWSAFKDRFRERRVLQFTATPFREDGRPLDGTIIFKYPLKLAQEEGYFAPIQFQRVEEFNTKRVDQVIAEKAVAQLRADKDKGHILMARVEDVSRAKAVFELYRPYEEFNPVQLHTGIKSAKQRQAIRQQIISGHSRIVVCVDMLGEGFDLPELKIAAFHDIRKTLAVTLQLAGRFTRARPDLGNATFIANTADVNVQEELRKLYTRDPDWNALLPQLSDTMIGEQVSLQEFLKGFTDFAEEIPLRTVRPATSAVAYRTSCTDWAPHNFREGLPGLQSCERIFHTVNEAERTLVIVTVRRVAIDWTDVEDLYSWQWELYVVLWSQEQQLLFINSSTNSGEYKGLAHAIAGSTATLIRGQQVFRTFSGVTRLRLQNVGLTEQLGRNVRYTGRMGADVAAELPDVQRRHARKSVLSGSGFEDGHKATVGASRKGRIWSHHRDRVDQFTAWCKAIGAKLLDEGIDADEVLKGTLESTTIGERPKLVPIAADWPETLYTTPEAMWSLGIGGVQYGLYELDLEVASYSVDGPIRIKIVAEDRDAELILELFEDDDGPNYRFVVQADQTVQIRRGERAEARDAAEFFYDDPPTIWFADGSALEGNDFVSLKNPHPPYDATKIQAWDWSGTNIRKESQGPQKEADSVQAQVVRTLLTGDYDMIVDDDARGEAADVVTIRLVRDGAAPTRVDVEFYHCKYSGGSAPGHRVDDLYEVCGQAQKSIAWISSHEKSTDLFTHLLRREAHRQDTGGGSRLERGDTELLSTIREVSRLCPVSLKIFIVQPGLSKAQVSREQLELLSVTETYLMETYRLPFGVIASS